MSAPLRILGFSETPYEVAWQWQQDTAAAVRHSSPDTLALLQHPPVYTFGRRVRPEQLLASPEQIACAGAAVVRTNRGGYITFHGPGQVVGYPILNLRRLELGPVNYVRRLEEALIAALALFSITAYRVQGYPGVWTGAGKIAAIGVRFETGVTLHGFALNVDTDLRYFDAIVPCGLAGTGVTSMSQLLPGTPEIADVEQVIANEFVRVFDYVPESRSYARQEFGVPR
jgi:lipoate-protein ligase B